MTVKTIWVCDQCGVPEDEEETVNRWFKVEREKRWVEDDFPMSGWDQWHFCSAACLQTWAEYKAK